MSALLIGPSWSFREKVFHFLTFRPEGESVDAAEYIVEDNVDEEVVPDELVDGPLPSRQQLEEDARRAR